MTPFFEPGKNPYGSPKVRLAAVGKLMTEVAGEVADGLILHAFTTERYVREVTIPALQPGFERGGRARESFEISAAVFIVMGEDDAEIAAAKRETKERVAFYASTPAYRSVLELHGWGELQPELNALSKAGEWVAMGERITDDMLDAFAVVGAPEEIPKLILARYGDIVDRVLFYAPYRSDPERWARILADFKTA